MSHEEADVWQATRAGKIVIRMPSQNIEGFKERLFALEILSRQVDKVSVFGLTDDQMSDEWRRHKRSLSDFNTTAYNTYDSVMDYLTELCQQFSKTCELITIGQTIEGRALKLVKISKSNVLKPKVYIDGGQHAREWLSPAVAVYIVQQLVTGIPENIQWLLDRYEFHILPIFNPDGYVYTYKREGDRFWRKNRKPLNISTCTGVDLNRNWNFSWAGAGGSSYSCSDVYYGEDAFSEEETRAASNYILNQSGWHSYFSLHSFGQMILFPWSHTKVVSVDFYKHLNAGNKLAEGIRGVNNKSYAVGSVRGLLYAAAGSSESWAYGAGGFPYAYTLELPDYYNFVVPMSMIEPTAFELIRGLVSYFRHIEQTDVQLYVKNGWQSPGIGNSSATPSLPHANNTFSGTVDCSLTSSRRFIHCLTPSTKQAPNTTAQDIIWPGKKKGAQTESASAAAITLSLSVAVTTNLLHFLTN